MSISTYSAKGNVSSHPLLSWVSGGRTGAGSTHHPRQAGSNEPSKTLQTSKFDIPGCEDTAQLPREKQKIGSRACSYSHTTTSKAGESLQSTSVLPGEDPQSWDLDFGCRKPAAGIRAIQCSQFPLFNIFSQTKAPWQSWEGTAGCPCCQGSPDVACLLSSSFLCHSWKFSQTRNVSQLKGTSSSSPALLPHETGAAAQSRAGFCPPGDGNLQVSVSKDSFICRRTESCWLFPRRSWVRYF